MFDPIVRFDAERFDAVILDPTTCVIETVDPKMAPPYPTVILELATVPIERLEAVMELAVKLLENVALDPTSDPTTLTLDDPMIKRLEDPRIPITI